MGAGERAGSKRQRTAKATPSAKERPLAAKVKMGQTGLQAGIARSSVMLWSEEGGAGYNIFDENIWLEPEQESGWRLRVFRRFENLDEPDGEFSLVYESPEAFELDSLLDAIRRYSQDEVNGWSRPYSTGEMLRMVSRMMDDRSVPGAQALRRFGRLLDGARRSRDLLSE